MVAFRVVRHPLSIVFYVNIVHFYHQRGAQDLHLMLKQAYRRRWINAYARALHDTCNYGAGYAND